MARPASSVRPARVLRLAERTMSRPTAPYREGAVIEWVRAFAEESPGLQLTADRDGNLTLRRRGVRRSRSPLVLSAHMDHPGFRVLRSSRLRRARPPHSHRVEAAFLGWVRPESVCKPRAWAV